MTVREVRGYSSPRAANGAAGGEQTNFVLLYKPRKYGLRLVPDDSRFRQRVRAEAFRSNERWRAMPAKKTTEIRNLPIRLFGFSDRNFIPSSRAF